MHAVLTNEIADILHFNDNAHNILKIMLFVVPEVYQEFPQTTKVERFAAIVIG